jgi:hypothetical protein
MPVAETGTEASTDGRVGIEGFDTTLADDRAALIYPFTFRC